MTENTQEHESEGFCPGCGEIVSTYTVDRDGTLEIRCSFCGLTLESAVFKRDIAIKECIIVVDDSELIKVMLKDALIENKVSKKVVTCENGAEFLTKIIERFEQHLPVDLVILDIQMPVMSGINAAVALRAIEDGFKRFDRRLPILFFSVKRCDDNLKKVLEYCTPAQYVNKGISNSKKEMFDRVKQVATQLLE